MRMAPRRGEEMLGACVIEPHRSLERAGPVVDSQIVSRPTMNASLSRSVVGRVLSVATVLMLVGFAASVDLQPDSALAAPGASADIAAGASYLEDDNRNSDDNRDNN